MRSEEEFDSLVGFLYEAALQPRGWITFIEHLADGLNAAQGQLALVDVQRPENTLVQLARFDPRAEEEYLRRRAQEDVWWQRLPAVRTGQCFTGSDLIGTSEFLSSPLARDIGHTTDIAFMLGGWYHKQGDVLGVVSVLRGRRRDDFSRSERATLSRLLPHLSRAMGLHRQLGQALQRARSLEAALNTSGEALFLTCENAQVRFLNSAAERLLRTNIGIDNRAGRLTLSDSAAQQRLERALQQHVDIAAGEGHFFAGAGSVPHRLLIRVFPIAERRPELLQVDAPCLSAVVVSDALPVKRSPPLGLLIGFFGLTRAEAIVAAHVAEGKQLREIAALEGRSIHTIRAQLKACFARIGVRTQAALVRRLHVLDR